MKEQEAQQAEFQAKLYESMAAEPMAFGHTFMTRHFPLNSPSFHLELSDAVEAHQFVAIAAPRGSAKSTLLAFLKPAHSILFKRHRFIVIISNTFKKAAMHLDTIKNELTTNPVLKECFPITVTRDAEGDSEFIHPDGFEIKVLCKGVDQLGSLRGVKFRAWRPDLIIIDDLEDDEMVKNPIRRGELEAEFDEVLNQIGDRHTRFVIVGTVLHDDSQLAKLINPVRYTEFHKIILKAHLHVGTAQECSLWPEKWSLGYLKELMRTKPNVYAKEMQNDPVAGSNVRFKKEDFRRWKQEGLDYVLFDAEGKPVSRGSLGSCRAAISCDLAWSEDKGADNCVLMPGYLTPQSEILIDKYFVRKGVRPHEIIEWLFLAVERLEKQTGTSVPIGFEKAMLEKVTKWILKQEMKKRNKYLITKELVWEGDKIARAETRLEPRYNQNSIFHLDGMGDLEYELVRFPSGVHDDLVDAAQGLVQLLQFPKSPEKSILEEDQFLKVRKFMMDEKLAKPKSFGRKREWIPAQRPPI